MRRPRTTSLAVKAALIAALAGLLATSGCGSSQSSEGAGGDGDTTTPSLSESTTASPTPDDTETLDVPTAKPTPVTMTGTVGDGVENGCQVFTDEATGTTYTLAEPLDDSDSGGETRVTITGTIDPDLMSFCMQGPILVVDSVTPALPTS